MGRRLGTYKRLSTFRKTLNMQVIILRGISGSGKSTWAAQQHPHATVASADHYFTKADGSYEFDVAQLQAAHDFSFNTFLHAAIRKDPVIIIDNTNIEAWEITPYSTTARALGYKVELITFACDPEVAIARKQLVHPDLVRRKAERLKIEEKRFPAFLKKIHRIMT